MNAFLTSAFLISFLLFGSLINGKNSFLLLMLIGALPFVSIMASDIIIATIGWKSVLNANTNYKIRRSFALLFVNSIIICACIYPIIKEANNGNINLWQYLFLTACVVLLQFFLTTFQTLMYQKQQLAKELDRAAHIIQSKSEYYNADKTELDLVKAKEHNDTQADTSTEDTAYAQHISNQSITPPLHRYPRV